MTKLVARAFPLFVLGLAPRLAFAQTTTPATPAPSTSPPPPPPPAAAAAETAPPEHGHAGLVVGLSVGYSAPSGKTTSAAGDDLSATFAYQIPVSIDLGVNILPSLFFGAYGTFAAGGPGGALTQTCIQDNCGQTSLRAGLVLEYRFLPGRRFEPWIGYGAGYDVSQASASSVNEFGITQQQSTRNWRGWDVAHIRAGLDFLVDPYSAAGIFADVGLGQFSSEWSQIGTQPGVDRSIPNPVMHQWVTVGVRWTFMP